MATMTYKQTSLKKLGRHHFAHVIAICEGVDWKFSAKRYFCTDEDDELRRIHEQTIEAMKTAGRRLKDSAWRLIGVRVTDKVGVKHPTLEDFIEAKGLDGWREDEALEMYAEAYGSCVFEGRRRTRLRERQVELVRKIESVEASDPVASDAIEDWIDLVTAERIKEVGVKTLGDLCEEIGASRSWFAKASGIGEVKARRIEAQVEYLIPGEIQRTKEGFSSQRNQTLDSTSNQAPSPSVNLGMQWESDWAAIEAWVKANARSSLTEKSYKRESTRFMAWLDKSLGGMRLGSVTTKECMSYKAFLQDIPQSWISRTRLSAGEPGWTPFRGKLSPSSQNQSVAIIQGLFEWLVTSKFLTENPWKKLPLHDRESRGGDALNKAKMSKFWASVCKEAPNASQARMRFLISLMMCVDIRPSEASKALLSDITRHGEQWFITVAGNGLKPRRCAIPEQAMAELHIYLQTRSIASLEGADEGTAMIASIVDPSRPVSYQAMYESTRVWMKRCSIEGNSFERWWS
jgi:site-specific recombinase XerD